MFPIPLGAIPWKLIGVAAIAGALAFLWWRNGVLADQRDVATGKAAEYAHIAETNAKAIEQLQAAHADALRAVERVAADAAARAVKSATIRQEIARAPATDNCPAVDVAVDGLRQLFAPAAP